MMQSDAFSIDEYLARIHFEEKPEASIACIRAVMIAHMQTIPFENIDVQLGKSISLEADTIIEKMIHRKRGGYCYEHNGLFAMFLDAMGVRYQVVGCRPMFYTTKRPRTHIALIVETEGQRWLCDLGFGALGINEPLNISCVDTEVTQGFDRFKLSLNEDGVYTLFSWDADAWYPQYGFNLSVFEWVDFVPANYFNYSHPDSLFVQKLLLLIKSVSGRHILLDYRLKSVSMGVTKIRDLSEEERERVLVDLFKVPESVAKQLRDASKSEVELENS